MKTEDEFEKIIQELRIVKWMAFVALIGVSILVFKEFIM